jgi:hypothetical protein
VWRRGDLQAYNCAHSVDVFSFTLVQISEIERETHTG